MKKFQIAILTVLSVLFVLIITTCKRTVALGAQVDVLQPGTSITRSVGVSDTVPRKQSFTISGEASDDTGVVAVTVVFVNRQTKEQVASMPAKLAYPNAPTTQWTLEVNNECTGTVEGHPLVKKYPIPDGEYDVIITTTDRNGKTSQKTLVYTMDNTPPVVIIERPALSAEKTNWKDAKASSNGSIVRVYGQVQDSSKLQSLTLTAYDSSDVSKSHPIKTNLAASGSISQEIATYECEGNKPKADADYTELLNLQGCDTSAEITANTVLATHNIIADYTVKDSVVKNDKSTGNENSFYFMYDSIADLFNGKTNGYKANYDAKTIYNYLSNRKPWNGNLPESNLLAEFWEDKKAQDLLMDAKIMCGTDAATATKKSVFRVDPNKDPGYYVSNLKVIDTATAQDMITMNTGAPLTVSLIRNTDQVPIVVSPITEDTIKNTKIKMFLVKEPASGGIDTLIENMKKLSVDYDEGAHNNKIGESGSESELIKIYDISKHTAPNDPTFNEKNGDYEIKVTLQTSTPARYGLVLVGQDSKENEFFLRDENSNRVSGGNKQFIVNIVSSGVPPTIIEGSLGGYYNKTGTVSHSFTQERAVSMSYSISKQGVSTPIVPEGPKTALTPSNPKITFKLNDGPWASATDGEYDITIYARNNAGNAAPKVVSFYLDDTKPTLSITSVTQGNQTIGVNWWITTGTVTVSGEASDATSGIEKLEASIDGNNWVPITVKPDGTFSGTIPVENATSTITVKAKDRAGNENTTTHTVRYDAAPPSITKLTVNGSEYTAGNKVMINSNIASGVKVEITADDGTGSGISGYEYSKDGITFTSFMNNSEISATDSCIIYVRVKDAVGLASTPQQIAVKVDGDKPNVAFNDGLNNKTVNKKIIISGTASDYGELKSVELKVESGKKSGGLPATGTLITSWNTAPFSPWEYELNTVDYEDNTDLVLKAIATDSAGNEETAEIRLHVDQNSDRPQIAVQNLKSLSGAYLLENTLRGLIQDDDGPVKEFYISEDGSNWRTPELNAGSWSYALTTDGEKTLYFKVVDNVGTEFISVISGDDLTNPRIYAEKLPTTAGDNGSAAPLKFTMDTAAPQIDSVQFSKDGANFENFASRQIFKGELVHFSVTARDGSGIKSVTATFDGTGTPISLTETAPNSGTYRASLNLADAQYRHGTHELIFTVTDNAGEGKESVNTKTIALDKKAPTASISYPSEEMPVAGRVPISGTIADDSDASSGVVPDGIKYIIKNTDGEPSENDSNWRDMTHASAGSFSFDFDFASLTSGGISLPSTWEIGSSKIYMVPLYILTSDRAGNQRVQTFKVRYDSEGNTPVVTIKTPIDGATVGGSFTVFGTGAMSIAPPSAMDKVYIRFSKDRTFDDTNCTINGVNWNQNAGKGVALDADAIKSGTWSYTANKDGKLNPDGTDQNWILYVQVCGENSGAGKIGYSEIIQITVDKDIPAITDQKVQKAGSPADSENYISNMWISEGMELTANITDSSDIEKVELWYGYAESEEKSSATIKKELSTQDGLTAIPNGYKLTLPLDLTKISLEAQKKSAFKVSILVTDKSTPQATNYADFLFRYDTTAPAGGYGEPSVCYGNTYFNAQSVAESKIADAVKAANNTIAAGVQILIDNVAVTPQTINGTQVTFSPVVSVGRHNYVVYTAKKIVKGSDCILKGVANDDGSGVKEVAVSLLDKAGNTVNATARYSDATNKLARDLLGNQCTWQVLLDTRGLVDGDATVSYTVRDQAGKTYDGTYPVFISNHPIAVTKVKLGTDLNVDGTIDDRSKSTETHEYTATETYVVGEPKHRAEVDALAFSFKQVLSQFAVEFTGGNLNANNKVSYALTCGNNSIKTGELKKREYIGLTEDDFNAIGDGDKELKLTLTDGTGWESMTTIKVHVGIGDTTPPTSAILPLYWNSKDENSITQNGKTVGHVEFVVAGSSNTKTQVSGTVIVNGVAYDDKLLQKLAFTFKNLETTLKYESGGWKTDGTASTGITATAFDVKLDQNGHYVRWTVAIDTEKMTGIVGQADLTVIAHDVNKFSDGNSGSVLKGTVQERKTYSSFTPGTHTPDELASIKPGQTVRLYDETYEAYYGTISKIEKGEVTFLPIAKTSADLTVKNYEIYTNTFTKTTESFDIVPFITEIKTDLSSADGGVKGAFSRASTGEYPVRIGSSITVEGFNLNGGQVELNGTHLGAIGAPIPISAGAKSGELSVKVGTIASINNAVNMNAPYNNEGNAVSNDTLTVARKLFVWNMEAVLDTNQMESPQFVMDSHSTPYLVFGNLKAFPGSETGMRLSTQKNTTQWNDWEWCYSKYHNTAIAYDTSGNMYLVASNTDRTSNSTSMTFFSQQQSSSSNYYPANNKRRFENASCGAIYDVCRVELPKLAVKGGGTASDPAKVALIYYDRTAEKQPLKFRYGKVSGPNAISGGLNGNVRSDVSVSLTGGWTKGSAPGYECIATTDSEYGSGKYVGIGMLKSMDRVIVAWYDAKNSQLVYSFQNMDGYTGPQDADEAEDRAYDWEGNAVKIDGAAPLYVDLVVDSDDGVHIAYYSSGEGGVKYAYLSPEKAKSSDVLKPTDFKVVSVDRYMNPGTFLKINVRKEQRDGKEVQVPYITYYHNGFYGSANAARIAWLKDGVASDGAVASGLDGTKFTGNWVSMTVPAKDNIQQYTICNGMPIDGAYGGKIIAAYFTNKRYEMAVLQK